MSRTISFKTNRVLFVAAIVFWLILNAPATALYSVTDLGPVANLPGQDGGGICGINGRGDVLAVGATNGEYRALLFNGNVWADLGTLGGSGSYAGKLNNTNQVAGTSFTTGGQKRAFLWTPGATDGVAGNLEMKDLGTFGGDYSEGIDINASGQVTGNAQTNNSDFNDRAFRYSNGVMSDIGKFLGNGLPNSYGYGINDNGWVVGAAYKKNNWSEPFAFYYDGSIAALIHDTNYMRDSTAFAINNKGRVAGYYTLTNDLWSTHAFYYQDGHLTDLGTLGGDYASARAINNDDVVVGGSYVDGANAVYHAFVSSGNMLMDLNDLLDSSGADWTLVDAVDINDAGQIIGKGNINGGEERMFLLDPVPIEPNITGITCEADGVHISFTTLVGGDYYLESRTNLLIGEWSKIVTNISGDGGVLTLTNADNGDKKRFFRVGLTVP